VSSIEGTPCVNCQNGEKKSREYDDKGYLASFTDWNNTITQYGDYDSRGQYGFKKEAVGTPEERRTDYTYDPRFNNKITTKVLPLAIVKPPPMFTMILPIVLR